jgi:hypothetical protein
MQIRLPVTLHTEEQFNWGNSHTNTVAHISVYKTGMYCEFVTEESWSLLSQHIGEHICWDSKQETCLDGPDITRNKYYMKYEKA